MKYLLLLWPVLAFAEYPVSEHTLTQFEEQRYCGEPARSADGSIKRSTAMLAAFKRAHPCPSTGLTYGACAGWSVDHVIPLACGGCDSVSNAQWLPLSIKSCAVSAGILCKDRFERVIYCQPMQIVK